MTSSQKQIEMPNLSSEEKQAVRLQVERLLSSSHFKNSRRYTDLLRFVVQQTIQGHSDTLKERTLGIEVFGREPAFDTSGDSIVRVAAAEVRKRLTQYYQEEGHQHELRIELPSGSYVPLFQHQPLPIPIAASAPELPTQQEVFAASKTPSGRMKLGIAAAVVTLIALASVFLTRYPNTLGRQGELLRPVWDSPQDAIICIGSPLLTENQPGAVGSAAAALGQPVTNNVVLPFADAVVLSELRVLLSNHHKQSHVTLARSTTLNDLRGGPSILIGALDNPWTMRLTNRLRFHFDGSDSSMGAIVDSKAGPNGHWSVDFQVPYSDRTQDYAIVAITRDDTLDQPLWIAAGIGPNGTMAAGEFLSSAKDLKSLAEKAPANWSGKGVEVVLATQVIQGDSGPPQIVATEYW